MSLHSGHRNLPVTHANTVMEMLDSKGLNSKGLAWCAGRSLFHTAGDISKAALEGQVEESRLKEPIPRLRLQTTCGASTL